MPEAPISANQSRTPTPDRRWLDALAAEMSDAVLFVRPDGEIVSTNAAYDRWFGAGADFVPEDDVGQSLPEGAWPQRRVANGEVFRLPFTQRRGDGTRHWYEAAGIPLPSKCGNPSGVLVIREVTDHDQRQLQEQFLSMAGHELRTPLTALSLSLDLAVRRSAHVDDDRLHRHLARAVEQTRKLAALALELIDIARLQSATLVLERAPADLAHLTRRAIATAQVIAADQPIPFESPDGAVVVLVDARHTEQAILNLLINAVTFSVGNGPIEVRLSIHPDRAEIDIRDHGPGIPPTDLQRIFERFYRIEDGRSAREGLGLGLFVARQILTAQDGSIEARSWVGKGSSFTVRLPLYRPDNRDESAAPLRGDP